ncbi:MAG: ribonuclease HII [Steroidobacteraceae bacterium]
MQLTMNLVPGSELIAGVDEAGRGPLAGPVVAAAVILDPARPIAGLADSKTLSAPARTQLAREIRDRALCFALGSASPAEIDEVNILQATFLAMQRALAGLQPRPAHVLIDGNRLPSLAALPYRCTAAAVIRGDQSVAAISAASILAKTERDSLMQQLHHVYPQFDFARNKGYPTAQHRAALASHGVCEVHRRSFAPVREALQGP